MSKYPALCIKRTKQSESLSSILRRCWTRPITSALLHLRAQIIRGKIDGLAHVEALLVARGVALPRVPKPHARNSLPHRAMSVLLIEALRDGPKGGVAAVRYVADHQPSISHR